MTDPRTRALRWGVDPALERRRAAWARTWRWLLADPAEEPATEPVAPATRPAPPPDPDGAS